MTVNTENYQATHGRKPSASRQPGLWVFIIRRGGSYTQVQKSGTYRDALRQARAEARTIGGAEEIIVGA